MKYNRPLNLRAGFHVRDPESAVPELLWAGEHWANRKYRIQLNTHEPWEFFLQITGEARWSAKGREYEWRPGTFFAIAPHVPHETVESFSSKYHYVYAGLNLTPILERYPELQPVWQGRDVIHIMKGESLMESFRVLMGELSTMLPFRAAALRLAVDYLVVEASRLLQDSPSEIQFLFLHPAVARARELMDNEPGARWKIADLGRAAGLSANNLSNLFSSEMGISPHQYLLRLRIDRARQLLRQSDVSIMQISAELGFSSSQHFATTFKRMVGVSAQDYRRRR